MQFNTHEFPNSSEIHTAPYGEEKWAIWMKFCIAPHGAAWLMSRDDIHDLINHLKKIADGMESLKDEAPKSPPRYTNLSPQAQKVYQHMKRAGSISARDAMDDYQMAANTLTRRIKDIEEEGFKVNRESRIHPIHQTRYTRYSLAA